MSSYVNENQSRGVGAIAADDLGAVSRASGSAVTSRAQLRSARKMAPKRTALISRRRRGAARRLFVQGRTGRMLRRPLRHTVASVAVPGRHGQPIVSRYAVPIVERPIGTVPSGAMTGPVPATAYKVASTKGRYSAVHTATGPTLETAVSARNKALDHVAETERGLAELQVPKISQDGVPDTRKMLIYGGIGVGAIALIYFMTRKR